MPKVFNTGKRKGGEANEIGFIPIPTGVIPTTADYQAGDLPNSSRPDASKTYVGVRSLRS